LLAELKPYADAIYGPTTNRNFKALAADLETVRVPKEFLRDTQIKTANISEDIAADQFLMDALEDLACYVTARGGSAKRAKLTCAMASSILATASR
jgi:hypothetical protein